jgi:N-acetylneuraminic acid mutarotase
MFNRSVVLVGRWAFVVVGILGLMGLLTIGQGAWVRKADAPSERSSVAIAELNGKLYLIGGLERGGGFDNTPAVEVYDPANDSWGLVKDYPERYHSARAVAANGRIYVFGGFPRFANLPISNKVFEYMPQRDLWQEKASMPTGRAGFGIVVLDGKIYTIGGFTGQGPSYSSSRAVEVYDHQTNQWEMRASLPTARRYLTAAAVGGKIYAVGGYDGGPTLFNPLAITEIYDPLTNTWQAGTALPKALGNIASVVINNRIYVIGGDGSQEQCWASVQNHKPQASVSIYDPLTNKWSSGPSLGVIRSEVAAAVVDKTIYAIGGRRERCTISFVNEALVVGPQQHFYTRRE